ncbi:hypothetical protein NIES2119_01505 [[Phormidium ambiguum] IAM M-71]|uniref:Lipase domain-containing protein n=1 Tax=[Phormidium ambiguum] IAM M-71 TaxID=454136 RepID=A0A1U7IU04_9CYAN|nr:hypothetical protein [Phormidium ambiguum]OKH41007.1 hypothetical protein NIES2119_01505 [Phormidium ambiguum IAM M-71]
MVQVNFNLWGNGAIDLSEQIDPNAQTYVIVHGWNNTGGNAANNYKPTAWMAGHAQTLRQRESNANIILVDWEDGARSPWYFPSANNTRDVGNQVAAYLRDISVDPEYTSIIGHSLGAHVSGFTGSAYRQFTGRSISQIAGLDPAGPAFEGRNASDRLDPSDATRVVSLHTSTTLGYDDPLATLDLYPNRNDLLQPGQRNFIDNHGYANILFTELLEGNSFTQSNGFLLNLNTVVNGEFVGVNNVSTKNNKAVVALNLSGTINNDNLAGGGADDNINGGAGNDKITGGDGNDSLFGDSNNDFINGGRGNDFVFGGTGSDRIFGDDGNDVLTGVNAVVDKGFGEIDLLTGGDGSDRFVLGDTQETFYNDDDINTSGISDYALFTDFNPWEDTIQLSGSISSYSLGESPTGLTAGTAIFLNETSSELIAIIQNSTNLSLNANYFITV